MYMNGNDKKKDIKEIIHKEKKLIQTRIEQLDKVIKGIKNRNNVFEYEDEIDNKTNTEDNTDENQQNNDNTNDDTSNEEL